MSTCQDPNTHAVPIIFTEHVLTLLSPCAQQEHEWQPTIIIGYYQCSRCTTLAACRACVSKVRGSAIAGLCRTHHLHLGAPLAAQQHHHQQEEVLG